MIKKNHALILAIIGTALTAVLFFIQTTQQPSLKNTTPDNQTQEISENQISSMLDSGYVDITSEAKPTEEDGWLKYEFRKSYINEESNNKPAFLYGNYNLFFPKGSLVFLKETHGIDASGQKIADTGGADIVLLNKDFSIVIDQAIMGFQTCSLNEKPEGDEFFSPCGEMYAAVINSNNTIEYIMGEPNYLLICDTTFTKKHGFKDNSCAGVTDIGRITLSIPQDNQASIDQSIEIIKRLEYIYD